MTNCDHWSCVSTGMCLLLSYDGWQLYKFLTALIAAFCKENITYLFIFIITFIFVIEIFFVLYNFVV